MRALVVGGTGPTGSAIVERLLAAGHDVTLYHTGAHELDFSGPVAHIHGDPTDTERLTADFAGRSFDAAFSMYGRLRAVAEALRGRVGRFVGITGGPVYAGLRGKGPGETGLPLPIPETAPVGSDPETDRYAHAIAQGERAVMAAHASGAFEAVLLRYPVVYGPRTGRPVEWYFVRRALDGRRRLLLAGDGLFTRQRGYTENLAHAAILAARHPRAAGETYNVGDTRVLNLRSLADLIARTLGHTWEMVGVPYEALTFGQNLVLYEHAIFDLSKIRSELGYEDVVPVEEATRRTVEWLTEHRPLPGGDEEQRLGDAFNYAEEDRLIEQYAPRGSGSAAAPALAP